MFRLSIMAAVFACTLVHAACSDDDTPSNQPAPGGGGEQRITGNERMAWDQSAADATELSSFRYAIYVDGTRSELSGVNCAAAQSGFTCSAPLPSMTPGAHTLEVASFVMDGATVLESTRSSSLRVLVAVLMSSIPVPGVNARLSPAEASSTLGRVSLTFSGSVDDVDTRGGGGLLAVAQAPDHARTGHVFAIYTTTARDGGLSFRLARFREVNGVAGERAVLLDDIPAARVAPRAVLQFGPDGKLYAGFDDGGDPRARTDSASYNGKLLRLNADGSVPRDSPSPIVADGLRSPLRVDWSTDGAVWLADSRENGAMRLVRVGP